MLHLVERLALNVSVKQAALHALAVSRKVCVDEPQNKTDHPSHCHLLYSVYGLNYFIYTLKYSYLLQSIKRLFAYESA